MKRTALFGLAIIVCVLSPCVCFAQISRSKADVDRDAQAAATREQRATEDAKRKAAEEVSRQQKAHAELPAKFQELDKIAAERERLKVEKALRAANVPTNVVGLFFKGKVLQILDGGILASGCVMTESERQDFKKDIADEIEAQRAAKATLVKDDAASAEYVYDKIVHAQATQKYRDEWFQNYTRTCLILGTPNSLVDDDEWHGHVYESGTYQYINTTGAKATVRKYTAIPKKK